MVGTAVDASLEAFSPLAPVHRRRPLVLVIDPDDTTRSVLEVAMTRDGFDVWTAGSASAGLMLLQGRLPDVVILEADLGGEEGFSLVAQLRGDERLMKIPMLLLARSDDEKAEEMAEIVGVDDAIRKPVHARDVAAMVRVELAQREGGPVLFDTKDMPPGRLLRALLSSPRSGRLLLAGWHAEIRFRSGKIVGAHFDASENSNDTVFRALACTAGPYELVLERVDGFSEMRCELREFVNVVMPRLQKWEEIVQKTVPLETRLMVDFAALAQALKSMPDDVNHIVQRFDGFRSVAQVLAESSFGESVTLEVISRLVALGVLKPAGAETVTAALRPMPHFFEPRPYEAEELMQQLFAGATGAVEVPAEARNGGEGDWYGRVEDSISSDRNDITGGWTTAPVPSVLSAGLAPELTRQIDAFALPMRVEAPPVAPPVPAAKELSPVPAPTPDSPLEAAVLGELELERPTELPHDTQARIETPWMTPAVVEGQRVTPVMTPAIVAVEAAFFQQESAPEVEAEGAAQPKSQRRLWPFVAGAAGIIALALLIDTQVTAPSAPGSVVVKSASPAEISPPTPVEAAVQPTAVPVNVEPEPEEVVSPVPIDVSENLSEARKLYENGQYKSAISVLEQVLIDEPNSVPGWYLLAKAKYDALDSTGARGAVSKVLELDPQNAEVHMLLATLHFDVNERSQGRASLEKYLELQPNGPYVKDARALLQRYKP